MNKNLPQNIDKMLKQKKGWTELPKAMNKYHDNGDIYPERKFVHEDGREAVYDGLTGELITDPQLKGTYNYVNPPTIKDVFHIGPVVSVLKAVGHFALDMVPYYIGGNNREDSKACKE